MSSETEVLNVPATVRALTALDRCDRCGAQAYLAVELRGSELLFCAHHGRKHRDALVAKGAVVTVDTPSKS